MNPSPEQLEALAAQTGFQSQTLEKVISLGEFAADIGRHPLLSCVLALKGGTALNLMSGVPVRLSVDLDFNYVGQPDRAQMQRERPQVEHALEVIGRGQGYRIQHSREARTADPCRGKPIACVAGYSDETNGAGLAGAWH